MVVAASIGVAMGSILLFQHGVGGVLETIP